MIITPSIRHSFIKITFATLTLRIYTCLQARQLFLKYISSLSFGPLQQIPFLCIEFEQEAGA
jgi:hypothetical protein